MKTLLWPLVVGFFCSTVIAADTSEWRPLFDGTSLKGWHPVGDGQWTVEGGAIVGRADKAKLYGLLVSDKAFKDFTVRFKFKCLSGDSGFYIRTIIEEPEKAHGLQVQVGRTGSGVGGIYESYGRKWIPAKPAAEPEKQYTKDDEWNDMRISARGGDIAVFVNGVKSAELKNDPSRPEGHFALQMHSGLVMHVMFKDIEIQEIASGAGK
ncbi:MAG TPA: DUF1080 domain-containing protein [Verrucomicrobiae bacterium]|nr:DUF1080 domain-containing protein [Verrucomicrobiae bacterium]